MAKFDKRLPTVKCSQKELDALDKKIKNSTLSKSEFLRNAIFFTEVKEVDKTFQKRVLFLLNNIANNANQIARYANTNKELDRSILYQLNEITDFIKSIKKDSNVS